MGVLALLASLSIPSIGSIMKGRALSDASDRTWTAVASARQEAIARQANVAMVLTNGRSSNPDKSDAVILLTAEATQGTGGAVTWTWKPITRWSKLPQGVEVKPESNSYLSSSNSTPSSAAYSGITAAIPKLDNESITSYSYVVFRPDGSVDSASSNPVLEFKRLRPDAPNTETALVLSPDSGRARIVRF